ncbi:MAG TPA: aminopeptidase P family protein, partial [Lachnospiraceae bacterium]|nr:aminopeptidase P family protein [Lachnospiraceae bacterium]
MNTDNKISEIMRQYAVDGLLISNGYNMRYLSGFSGATGYLFLTEDRKVILTDFRYTIQAENESSAYEVFEIDGSYEEAINMLIKEENIETLGFESQD